MVAPGAATPEAKNLPPSSASTVLSTTLARSPAGVAVAGAGARAATTGAAGAAATVLGLARSCGRLAGLDQRDDHLAAGRGGHGNGDALAGDDRRAVGGGEAEREFMRARRQRRRDHRELARRIGDDSRVGGAVQQQRHLRAGRGAAGDHAVAVGLHAHDVEGGRRQSRLARAGGAAGAVSAGFGWGDRLAAGSGWRHWQAAKPKRRALRSAAEPRRGRRGLLGRAPCRAPREAGHTTPRRRPGQQARAAKSRSLPTWPSSCPAHALPHGNARLFSCEVETRSREEHASKQDATAKNWLMTIELRFCSTPFRTRRPSLSDRLVPPIDRGLLRCNKTS